MTTRLERSLTLPHSVLRKHHRSFAKQARQKDSEAVEDLIADGIVKLVQLDRKHPQDMDEEEFRGRAAGSLRKFYQRQYNRFHGRYSTRVRDAEGRVRHTMAQRKVTTVSSDYDKVLRAIPAASSSSSEQLEEMVWREAMNFLDGLSMVEGRVMGSLLSGSTKAEIAKKINLPVREITKIIRRATKKMKEGGVL